MNIFIKPAKRSNEANFDKNLTKIKNYPLVLPFIFHSIQQSLERFHFYIYTSDNRHPLGLELLQ